MSRFRILATFATLAALATVLAACGGSGDGSDDPQAVIENATLEGVESGVLDLTLHVRSSGSEGGDLTASVSGPFQGGGTEDLPQLDLEAKANGNLGGEATDFEGGLTVLADRAFVSYEGTDYEVDPTTFGFVKSGLEQAQKGSKDNAGDPTACQDAVSGLKLNDVVGNLKNEGSAEIDGTSTTKVGGDLKVGSAVDVVIELVKDPACSTQLEAAGPLPLSELEKGRAKLTSAVKKAHAELYVGDDDIIRKLAFDFTIAPKESDEKVELEAEVSLGEVNESQEISAPSGAKPIEILFRKLDINPLELLEAGTSGEGFGDLLEGLNSDSGGGGGSSGGGGQEAYLECLQNAKTPTDLQNCASL